MSITLKEAFRYQNYLDRLLNEAMCYLRRRDNVMETVEEHMRSKFNEAGHDETKSNKEDRETNIPVDTIVDFACTIYKEKATLSKKINDAKNQHCNTMDLDISLNKLRQSMMSLFKDMNSFNDRKVVLRGAGTDYCFNGEGNQVPYKYDVSSETKADFSRKKLRDIIAKYSEEANKVSNTIDYWRSSVPVDHNPMFDGESTFMELLAEYNDVDISA